ncbi:hypothetical protein H5T51_08940, partial [Candidatus Bathyarchaeota archaeon]|nr:hypothetical protein [Candidatus Bathyarchaeota archaeon]
MKNSIILGLFAIATSWFVFTTYYFGKATVGGIEVPITDIPGFIGLGFRTAAALIAFIAMLFYLFRRNLSSQEALMTFRWILLLEAVYWLTLLPSAYWGLVFEGFGYWRELIIVSTGIPCLVEALVIPAALFLLFIKLNPKASVHKHLGWGLTSGALYMLVFWFNYSMQWAAEIMRSGLGFVTIHPANTVSFILTVFGLFALSLYAFSSAWSFWRDEAKELNLKVLGLIILAFGVYFDINYLMWLLFGSPGGWNMWHIFFIHHNADLWMLALPLAGLPLYYNEK